MKTILFSKAFWLSFLITLLLSLFLASRTYELIPGVTAMRLIKGCELDFFHDTRLQPVFTVALACPRVDYIRLWPLPIKQPWSEETPTPPARPLKLLEAYLHGSGTQEPGEVRRSTTLSLRFYWVVQSLTKGVREVMTPLFITESPLSNFYWSSIYLGYGLT
jgi:hypothetical protein